MTTKVTFEFPTEELAQVFAEWFDNIGEENYFEEGDYDREVVSRFSGDYENLVFIGEVLDE